METVVNGEKEMGVIINKPITLRQVIRETLNTSYNGHNEGCFNCAEINEIVDHFVQGGHFTIYRVVDHIVINEKKEHGYFMRKEFAEEEIKKRKMANKENNSYGHDYAIEEVDVKI